MKHTILGWVNGKIKPVEYDTLLEALADQRVMTIEAKEGGFEIREKCDNYFSVRLTPDQLRELGEELIAIAHTPQSPDMAAAQKWAVLEARGGLHAEP
jgi:hypothetical protein